MINYYPAKAGLVSLGFRLQWISPEWQKKWGIGHGVLRGKCNGKSAKADQAWRSPAPLKRSPKRSALYLIILSMYYVYILKWKRYYCGSTNDLKRRLKEHRRWKTITTKTFSMYDLVWYYLVNTDKEVLDLEKKIKKSGHIERWINNSKFINSWFENL